jgi:ferredoxin
MKLVVDMNVCQGHARCWDLCPEVFDLDEEGLATVILDEVPPELESKARQAANNCPERAITVTS